MRFNSSIPVFCTVIFIALLCPSCKGNDPILLNPDSGAAGLVRFATGINVVKNYADESVWVGAGPGTVVGSGIVDMTVHGMDPFRIRAFLDGSFLYKFHSSIDEYVAIRWLDPSGKRHDQIFTVYRPSDRLIQHAGKTGLYPNRMNICGSDVWVINSGDDAYVAYNLENLHQSGPIFEFPQYSNPWEAAWMDDSSGYITTLFSGVFRFELNAGEILKVSPGEFRDFASPNGVAVLGNYAWVANPNPVSYFPSVMGDGWISKISDANQPRITGTTFTSWKNPQNFLTDGNLIYVSCAGTVDFLPPEYMAIALDSGGVQVLNPENGRILKSYPLGMAGAGRMTITPDGRYLYVASTINGWIFRIDLKTETVLNDASNPIIVDSAKGTFISDLAMTDQGLLIASSFNSDTLHFINGWTGELNPFPFFEEIPLHPENPGALWGVQDIEVTERYNQKGILILTTVKSEFHWLPL